MEHNHSIEPTTGSEAAPAPASDDAAQAASAPEHAPVPDHDPAPQSAHESAPAAPAASPPHEDAVAAEPPAAAADPVVASEPVAPTGPVAAAQPDAGGESVAQAAPHATADPIAGAEPAAAASEPPAAVEASAPGIATDADADAAVRAVQQAANAAKAEERRARSQQAWERVVAAHANGESLTGNVTAAVKGGLLVDIAGIRGFLPASQARVALGTAIETLVKTKVPLKVIDVDTARRRVVVSHRRAVEDDRRSKRAELLKSLQVGETREGVVVRLADFGAFVDLGGIDGLIPMRELAFERVEKVQDVLTVGDRLPVVVLRIEENGKKISLSRKNALPDPWRDHADVLRRDTTVHGKVVGKEPRLQVELAPGVVGTVRESDADPAEYEIGEAIEVAVRSVDRATRRISLTTMHGAAAVQQQQTATTSGFAPLGIELSSRPKRR